MENNVIIYGKVAKEIWAMGCKEMRAYNKNWDFGIELEDAIGNLFAEMGLNLSNGIRYITDNVYINGDWGTFENYEEYQEFLENNSPDDCLILTKEFYLRNF